MAIDLFRLDDVDDSDFFSLDVSIAHDGRLVFSFVDKTTGKELNAIVVDYSDFIGGLEMLRRPTLHEADVAPASVVSDLESR